MTGKSNIELCIRFLAGVLTVAICVCICKHLSPFMAFALGYITSDIVDRFWNWSK